MFTETSEEFAPYYLAGIRHDMRQTTKIVFRKRLSRHDLMPFLAKLPPVLIGLEACGGAHYWARRFREHGHEVKLMAPQFVKPYGATCKSLL